MRTQPIPAGYCQCGCGGKTPLARNTRGPLTVGQPTRYLRGHHLRRPTDPATCRPHDATSTYVPVHRGDEIVAWSLIDNARLADVLVRRWTDDGAGYAKAGGLKLHHLIAGRPPAGMVVDHINGDKLDNREENLRTVTPQVNQRNRFSATARSASGHRNVVWNKRLGKWQVYLSLDGEAVYGGTFADLEKAIRIATALRRVLFEEGGA